MTEIIIAVTVPRLIFLAFIDYIIDRAPRRDYANDRRDAPPAPSRREHDDAPPPKRADSQSPRGASDNRRSSRSPRR